MKNSQNGWSVIGVKELDNTTVAGVPFIPGIRQGDVSTVLRHVAQKFHDTVEPLVNGWCWGYANKLISGSSDISNHASGTAIDINAPRHPMGKAGTFNSNQVTAIRNILNELEGVVRWGGDYSGRKDEMHFEINADTNAVARIAAKVSGTPTPAPTPPPSPSPAPQPSDQFVFLPSSQDTWRLYDVNVAPKAGNEKATLRPSKFPPGLTYKIYAWRDNGTTVEIQTQQFGRGKIYVAGTVARISGSATPTPAPPSHVEKVKPGTWNVRANTSTNSAILGQVSGGQTYETKIVTGNWRQITFNGRLGFVGPAAW